MTDRIFLDTNVLVYLFDTSEEEKHAAAKQLLKDHQEKSYLHISSQVVNEFINITTRKITNPITFNRQKKILQFFQLVFLVSPLTIHTSLAAVDLKLKYKFSYWDSLILASASENMCFVIYSEDMQHDQLIENRLKIVNPFI